MSPNTVPFFKRALILSLTNPKAILFYVSFFSYSLSMLMPHIREFHSLFWRRRWNWWSFCYLSFLIISGAFVTQYIRTKKKLAKVGNSLIGLMFVGFAARLATLQS
ncbi:LysE family transporter [Escherichia coli]|nr:LysE family transporter [Escherichia coli]